MNPTQTRWAEEPLRMPPAAAEWLAEKHAGGYAGRHWARPAELFRDDEGYVPCHAKPEDES